MSRRESQVVDEYQRPVPGASIYVLDADGLNAVLTSDGVSPLEQPVTTDEFGVYAYWADDGLYREDIYYGGKLRYREVAPVGILTDIIENARESIAAANRAELAEAGALAAEVATVAALGGVVLANATLNAATRVILAALDHTLGLPAYLEEGPRAGMFVWDGSNLAAKVAADPQQGIYVPPVADATGATGAWVRGFDGPYRPEWFGAFGAGVTNDTVAVQAAFTAAAGRAVRLSQAYLVTTGLNIPADTVIDARGGTIISVSAAAAAIFTPGARVKIIGGKWSLTGGSDNPWHFDVNAADITFDGAWIDKTPDAGGYQFYVRAAATNFAMRGCRTSGSNGIYVEGSGSSFIGNSFVGRAAGGDDAIAIKGIAGFTRNIRITGNYFENLVAAVSIGSEIGTAGVNDATYAKGVGQVVCSGNTLKNCYGIAFIKPGAIGDYRDGTVEDVIISNNTLVDLTGVKFERGITVTPGRGARIRGVRGNGNIIRARTKGGAGRLVGALDVLILGDLAGGTAAASASDIGVEVDYFDPYDGLSNAGGRPGFPATRVVSIDRNAGVGVVSEININLRGNGSAEAGLLVGFGIPDNAVRIKKLVLTNVNQTNPVGQGGAYLGALVQMEGPWKVTPAAGTELAFTDASLTQEYGRGGFNTPKNYQIGGVNVLTGVGAAIADAGGAAAVPTQAEFNALAATVNAILLRMRNATPTIAV